MSIYRVRADVANNIKCETAHHVPASFFKSTASTYLYHVIGLVE